MYKVYKVYTSLICYTGNSFIAADNAKEANGFIHKFKEQDEDNKADSWGYCDYISEDDVVEHMFSDIKGIIVYGIYYTG